jgi:gluconolactonase
MTGSPARMQVLVDGLDHPEGVVYDPSSGDLYAGGEKGQIYRVDMASHSFREVAHTPGFVLGLAIDGRGRLVVCDSEDGAVWVLDGGRLTRLLASVDDRELTLPNFPAFGPDGTLYVSDSGGWNRDRGMMAALHPDGSSEIVDDTTLTRFPNGCAVTPDGKELWVLQSEGEDLHRVDLVSRGRPELLLRIPDTVPDGIAFTTDGGALISCYRPDRIYHFSADGDLEILAEDHQGTMLAAPTNVCFAGDDLGTLVSANLGRWHLTLIETGLRGVPLHAPSEWAYGAPGE